MKIVRRLSLLVSLSSLLAMPALVQAQDAASPALSPEPSRSTWPAVTRPADRGPRHYSAVRSGTFGGKSLRYRAVLSEMLVRDRAGKPASSLFVTAFVAGIDQRLAAQRPVIFIFNGGPGGSSNTLMFGAMGPSRLQAFDVAAIGNAKTPVVPNEDAVLDIADLVFIDAPETGYGRPLPGSDEKTFRSNDGDSNAFAQVILRWLTDNGRMASPVYIMGESYGSIRAVLLARDLRVATPRVEPAGLILVSQALWYNGPETGMTVLPDPVRAVNSLPDIAALAWHHGLIDNRTQTLEQAVRAAQTFALQDYAKILIAGNRAPETERACVAERLAQLTGVPASTWLAGSLRLSNIRRQMLAGRNLALGQFDGREIEPLQGIVDDSHRDFKAMMAGLTAATGQLRRDLFHAEGLPDYRSTVDSPPAFEETWTFNKAPMPGTEIILREQMAAMPKMRLMVTQGVFDTTTTMGETDYQFAQIAAPQDRTTFAYYPGGHMLYSEDEGRRAFLSDVRTFISGQVLARRPFPHPAPGQIGGRKQATGQ
ncbi:peptidase S10, serine carboxypeptidase [Rhizorhabdus wittichii RW1]|uniref:Peptidase S10, serine carboxypeptidase n=1 Tax=Rhizorhabdus wittichii (strain DSM 6014 / CCUG 31198 / JCM 15750 / NBRC 105917 / EY 4224 / RW1) TaxID=392499 RepID=A0A9J9LBH8_RHIWR|nr:peptidase S10, serine carboxypeptidase [Rhizorhabdus wittichii RW1]